MPTDFFPLDLQERIWRTYFSNIVLKEYNNLLEVFLDEILEDTLFRFRESAHIRWLHLRWNLTWHFFRENCFGIDLSVSRQKQISDEFYEIGEEYHNRFHGFEYEDCLERLMSYFSGHKT